MEISYYRQKPKIVRTQILNRANDDNTYIYLITFSQIEEVTDDGITIKAMGIMMDYFGSAIFVTVDLDYWIKITPEVFYLEAPNMLGKAFQDRMNEKLQTILN